MKIKIISDNKIPFINGVTESVVDIKYISGSTITSDDIKNADALLTRTRTICNRTLLEGSSIKFIGTATIGFDHIDIEYCKNHGIDVSIASGCNAGGVVNYVLTALAHLGVSNNKTVGIIGVGNVGTLLNERLKAYGFKTILNDPPKEALSENNIYSSLDYLLQNSDIITIHTPLIKEGVYKTDKIASESFFDRCKKGAIFINTSRGETVDDNALINAIENDKISSTVIDVWNHEPLINSVLLEKSTISTPHIAGYSIQGKANGSSITICALAKRFNINSLKEWYPEGVPKREISSKNWDETKKLLLDSYDISKESAYLKQNRSDFEKMRDNYDYRNEVI